jgi:hypothetical protein
MNLNFYNSKIFDIVHEKQKKNRLRFLSCFTLLLFPFFFFKVIQVEFPSDCELEFWGY